MLNMCYFAIKADINQQVTVGRSWLKSRIQVLNKSGLSQREIASAVDVSQSTISRELARNRG
ncbi:helix-turn-helix domain-containing protein, partial [Haliea salexigens]|uniref:helix-turn-helix domain-containing protein n=1 Tax=Haliea salexigens TaxID=287487 RepID=UPI001184384F